MRRVRFQPLVILALGIVLLFTGSAFSQMSIDGQYNIAELMQTAQNSFDLDNQDAVFLLDKKRVDWLPDGRMIEKIHRIIWIGTNYAVDHYGDHRIPYDSKRCDFNVTTVRTWRDGAWWITGETGIVETLPYELSTAYDYTNIREMMLLHNGIEIPCILEIAYVIEDKEAFRPNIEGHWNLKRMEPCVKSILTLGVPKGEDFYHGKHFRVPDYVKSENGDLDAYTWEMGPIDAMPYPHTEELKKLEPFVNWSTWDGWEEYGFYLDSLYKSHTRLDGTLKAIADSIGNSALTTQSRINGAIEYINNKTRLIDYPIDYWLYTPRDATRIFTTGYCHPLDRAILTIALLDHLKYDSRIIFISTNHVCEYGLEYIEIPNIKEPIDPPTILGLFDACIEFQALRTNSVYYDPKLAKLYSDIDFLRERYYWRPGIDKIQDYIPLHISSFLDFHRINLELSYDKELEKFTGKGAIESAEIHLPYGEILGINGEMKEYLLDLISGILGESEITTFNPELFNTSFISLQFQYTLPKSEVDDYGRLELILGEPRDGIFARLPEDLELYNPKRSSGIYLPEKAKQSIKLRIDLDDLEVIYIPEKDSIENDLGYFSLDLKMDEKYLTIQRTINLKKPMFSEAENWPALRQLLLAETHDRNQTIYLKIKEEEKE